MTWVMDRKVQKHSRPWAVQGQETLTCGFRTARRHREDTNYVTTRTLQLPKTTSSKALGECHPLEEMANKHSHKEQKPLYFYCMFP